MIAQTQRTSGLDRQRSPSPTMTDEQQLSHVEHVERAVVCSIIADPHMVDAVRRIIGPQHFRSAPLADLFTMAVDAADRGVPLDLLQAGREVAKRQGSADIEAAAVWAHSVSETLYHGSFAAEYAQQVREAFQRRELARLGSEAIRLSRDPHADVSDSLADVQKTAAELSAGVGPAPARPISESIISTLDQIGSGTRQRTPTGFTGLDGMIGGVRPGQLVVIGARPAMGKSAFALNILDNVASTGTPCGLVSLEMSTQELSERLLARRARVGLHELEFPTPATKHALAEAAAVIERLPLILDESSRGLEDVVSSIRTMRRKHKTEVVAIDYLQLVRPPDARAPREQQVAAISRRLKEIAVEQQIGVVALCQLNRMVEGRDVKTPRLSDIRDSGSVEQDADVVLFIHRPGYYDQQVADDRAQIIVAKQRQGATGSVELGWRGSLTTFSDRPGAFGD